jgi:hypothetical protein
MSQQTSAPKTPERLPIVRTLLSNKKILRVLVQKNNRVRSLSLEKVKGDRWRDQTSHFWTIDENEIVAVR